MVMDPTAIPSEVSAVVFVIESSQTLWMEWKIILSDYVGVLMKRLYEAYPKRALRIGIITYSNSDTLDNPILAKMFFMGYANAFQMLKSGKSLKLGEVDASPKKGMAALEALVAAVELFDDLDASLTDDNDPSNSAKHVLRHIVHIVAGAPDQAPRPMWNLSPKLDFVSWDTLPEEMNKRNIFYSAVIARQATVKYSQLHQAVGNRSQPWFAVRPNHTVLLSGFPNSPPQRAPAKRPNEAADRPLDPKRARMDPQQQPQPPLQSTPLPPHLNPANPQVVAAALAAMSKQLPPAMATMFAGKTPAQIEHIIKRFNDLGPRLPQLKKEAEELHKNGKVEEAKMKLAEYEKLRVLYDQLGKTWRMAQTAVLIKAGAMNAGGAGAGPSQPTAGSSGESTQKAGEGSGSSTATAPTSAAAGQQSRPQPQPPKPPESDPTPSNTTDAPAASAATSSPKPVPHDSTSTSCTHPTTFTKTFNAPINPPQPPQPSNKPQAPTPAVNSNANPPNPNPNMAAGAPQIPPGPPQPGPALTPAPPPNFMGLGVGNLPPGLAPSGSTDPAMQLQLAKMLEQQRGRQGPGGPGVSGLMQVPGGVQNSAMRTMGGMNPNATNQGMSVGGMNPGGPPGGMNSGLPPGMMIQGGVMIPQKSPARPVWSGPMRFAGTGSDGVKKETIFNVIAASQLNAEACHVKTWPSRGFLMVPTQERYSHPELQLWMAKYKPIVAQILPDTRGENAQVNISNFQLFIQVLLSKQVYATSAWTTPTGSQTNNVLFIAIPGANKLMAAFFPLHGIPEMPRMAALTAGLNIPQPIGPPQGQPGQPPMRQQGMPGPQMGMGMGGMPGQMGGPPAGMGGPPGGGLPPNFGNPANMARVEEQLRLYFQKNPQLVQQISLLPHDKKQNAINNFKNQALKSLYMQQVNQTAAATASGGGGGGGPGMQGMQVQGGGPGGMMPGGGMQGVAPGVAGGGMPMPPGANAFNFNMPPGATMGFGRGGMGQ
ncbi:hypothetical protein CC1G_10926 [Coprinopsis cinerea okayama7|uniref:Mediator of RNA polymerase II transcription subunit 25 von Willebrand factor type A domain-containing protein n=1 Tax=Coprinopsis cinerea (strain Okayama-7 / 130 / ATCC MYA-4618 / FGSC 9003) TaxID=240176 RepID=A8NT31_COPC7|nr:hypothetical protein CC1G_10926 [Coprinopsis cinerea okayama7\|eukprot:XP_001836145.2 hypothetical protein CC1G_10926 [Coprinopsis cinerea okayama7\